MNDRAYSNWLAAACLLLAACPWHHEPLRCGVDEACPSGYACSDGVCMNDDACREPTGYAYVDGQCSESCQADDAYADRDACCEAHPDACATGIRTCPPEPCSEDATDVVAVDLRCEYGEETCCGMTYPSIVCIASAGEPFAKLYTDACFNEPQCTP